jgi:NAD(P)-dependent dehydrogenase (short-subunit alcohol dehydrogenase family)
MSGALDGKGAVVTGAGSGIGAAIAEAYAREGASLCLVDWSVQGSLDEVAGRCERAGNAVLVVGADVSNETDRGQHDSLKTKDMRDETDTQQPSGSSF